MKKVSEMAKRMSKRNEVVPGYLQEGPHPPEGYYLASVFRPPRSFFSIVKYPSFFVFLACFALPTFGVEVLPGFAGSGALVFMAVVFVSPDLIRGVIQRGIARLLGYSISFYAFSLMLMLPWTYTAAPRQLLRRRDALLIASAPLSMFIALCIPLLFVPSGLISSALTFFLVMNIIATAWDLYFMGWLLRLPGGTMLYREGYFEHLLAFEAGSANVEESNG